MSQPFLIAFVMLCLVGSVGARYFITGSYVPDMTILTMDQLTQQPINPNPNHWQSLFDHVVTVTSVSATIAQISLFDIDENQVWDVLDRAQALNTVALHKMTVSQGQSPRSYRVDIVIRAAEK